MHGLGSLEAATGYAKQRIQLGKAVGEFRSAQFQLATMATEVEAARLLARNAARLRDSGRPLRTEAAMAQYYSSEIAERSIEGCRSLWRHGDYEGLPDREALLRATIGRIYEGTGSIQLLTIARKLLGR
jgi:alkylation response protein AidB-like acyl-CoA dehydrogenase